MAERVVKCVKLQRELPGLKLLKNKRKITFLALEQPYLQDMFPQKLNENF